MRDSRKMTGSGTKKAAAAVARLYSGDMTAEEERSLERWLERDVQNRQEYQAMLELWDLAGDAGSDEDISGIPEERPRWHERLRGSGNALRISVAAVLVAGIVAFFLSAGVLISIPATSELTSYETDVGERREVVLSDGSVVVLNTNTRLIVDFNNTRRRIVMNRGEAYFDIRRDPQRPLSIMVGGRSVSVLGTKFSVRWSGPEVVVAVVEGTVSVHSSSAAHGKPRIEPLDQSRTEENAAGSESDEVILDTGSLARFSEKLETEIAQEPQKVQQLQSWRFGLSRFENETLETIVAEINRYSRRKIVIGDRSVRNLRLTGVFRVEDIDAVLTVLQEVLPVQVVRDGNRYVIVARQDGARSPNITVDTLRPS